MKTETTLEPVLVAGFKRIIADRHPSEACGVMLPSPHRGQRIWEMPNRSMTAQTNFRMDSSDVRMALGGWIEENLAHLHEVTFWHSHPSGDSTPSKADIDNRVHQACNLVLAIDESEQLHFTWF